MEPVNDDTDELFLVLSGRLTIQLRERDVVLGAGERTATGEALT